MTEKILRNALKEAQEKEQLGLFIWPNWTVWEELVFYMRPKGKYYNFAVSQISKGEEATISFERNGLSMPGIIAVSVQKLSSSSEFFSHVLSMCEEAHYEGPIILVPANIIMAFH